MKMNQIWTFRWLKRIWKKSETDAVRITEAVPSYYYSTDISFTETYWIHDYIGKPHIYFIRMESISNALKEYAFQLLFNAPNSVDTQIRGHRHLESTNDDKFWVPSSNDTYTPSANVRNGHMLSGQKFSLTMDYFTALLTLPILFLALGIVSWLFTLLGLLFRCCCKCCRCLPKEKGETEEEKVHAIKTQKRGWTGLFFALVLAVVIADFLCYYGYDFIDQGVNKFYDAMQLLYKIVNNINLAAYRMNKRDVKEMIDSMSSARISCCTTYLKSPYTRPTCESTIDTLSNTLPLFESATSSIYNAVKPFDAIMLQFIDLTKQYLFDLRKLAIFVIFAIALVDVILLVISEICQSRRLMKFSVTWGMLFFLIIILLCFPFMIFTSLFADLCTHPTKNLARQVTGSSRELIVFYSTCVGKDSIRDNFVTAQSKFTDIQTNVNTLKDNICPDDPNMPIFTDRVGDLSTQLDIIGTQISCPTLRKVLLTFLNESLCGGIYSGIYSIWISQLITSFFFLMLLITSTVLYQYYGVATKVFVSEGHTDEHHHEHGMHHLHDHDGHDKDAHAAVAYVATVEDEENGNFGLQEKREFLDEQQEP